MGAPLPSGLFGWARTRPPEHSVACPVPYCRAQPRHRCTGPSGRTLTDVHPSRVALYNATKEPS